MDVKTALATRKSVRGFLQQEVPREILEGIFERAQRAPSWCNIQPWRVAVFSGEKKNELVRAMVDAAEKGEASTDFPWPLEYPEPYGTHRRECGMALYQAMGIARDDKAGRHAAWVRNFRGFDAPHIAMVGVDKRFPMYAAIDIGTWLQSVLLSATEAGIATCAQAALAVHANAARPFLHFDEHIGLFFGISMGYEDPDADANRCATTRSPLSENIRFY